MSNKRVCRRFKRTGAGKRCAQYGGGTNTRRVTNGKCVRFQTTKNGRKCAKFGEKD